MSNPRAKQEARDTGRMAFRHEWEAVDERPLLIDPHGFWADETERMTYEDAVQANPRRPDEGPASYIRRISEMVTGKYKALGLQMPRTRMSRRERDQQLAKLRAQARPDLPEWIEDRA